MTAYEPVTGGRGFPRDFKLRTLLPTPRRGRQSEEGEGLRRESNLRSDLGPIAGRGGMCLLKEGNPDA